MKAKQDAEITLLGRTFIRDANEANAFSELSRYETAIQRSFSKALHELQRLKTTRGAGGNVSPPVAVDVDVSGPSSEGL
jgi:fumarate hydratase class II